MHGVRGAAADCAINVITFSKNALYQLLLDMWLVLTAFQRIGGVCRQEALVADTWQMAPVEKRV